MKKIQIIPTKLQGTIKVPPSKSMAHRAIICAALSQGESVIRGVDFSEDICATIEGMRALGASILKQKDTLMISGKNFSKGINPMIDCKESGSTLRFLIPISLVHNSNVHFIGKGQLGKRPLNSYYQIFKTQGICYTTQGELLDLTVEGVLKPGLFELEGNVSSQFISGLLFALPLLKGDSTIRLTTELESKAYIDLTLQMMRQFGIHIDEPDARTFVVKGNQVYKASNYEVEGDYSQAAFYAVASALGNKVGIKGLAMQSAQGDRVVLDLLKHMGCAIELTEESVEVIPKSLKAIRIDGSECPDIIPIITVAAALSEGVTTIVRAERLRIKECDRLYAIAKELGALGAKVEERQDGLLIEGVRELKGGCNVSSHNDHRIAMSIAIAATRCMSPIILEDYTCVKKSYLHFWDDYRLLGGVVKEATEDAE